MDTNLLVVLFFIMVFGFIMIYSASYYKAGMSSAFNNDSMYFLKRQVVFSMVGVLVMLVVAGVNYHCRCGLSCLLWVRGVVVHAIGNYGK